MPHTDAREAALARWFSQGPTSLTHPVLRRALSAYLSPLGIEAAWLEAEPFSGLESGSAGWWLRSARWNPEGLDRASRASADFEFLLVNPRHFSVAVDSQGVFSVSLAAVAGPSASAVLPRGEDADWRVILHSVRASQRAETLIHAAAGAILAGDPATELYVRGEDSAFLAAVEERICLADPKTRGGDGAAAAAPSRASRDPGRAEEGPAAGSTRLQEGEPTSLSG